MFACYDNNYKHQFSSVQSLSRPPDSPRGLEAGGEAGKVMEGLPTVQRPGALLGLSPLGVPCEASTSPPSISPPGPSLSCFHWPRGVQACARLQQLLEWIRSAGFGEAGERFFRKLSCTLNLLATPSAQLIQVRGAGGR